MAESHPQSPIVITHEGGLAFAAQIRSHRIVTDQPRRGGGADAGPMPLELLSASLGSCVALYVLQYLQSRGLRTDDLRVEVEPQGAMNPRRIWKFVVRVLLPEALPPREAAMLERVARSCPAHHTLELGAEVALQIETPVAAG